MSIRNAFYSGSSLRNFHVQAFFLDKCHLEMLFTVGPLSETFIYKLSFWTNADELSVYFDLHQSRHSDSIRQGLVPNNSLPIRLTMQFIKDLIIVVFSHFSFDTAHPAPLPIVDHNF